MNYFSTPIYQSKLKNSVTSLNKNLIEECEQVRGFDKAGVQWSKKNYFGGYTSYSSWNNMNKRLSTFVDLEKAINLHVKKFVTDLEWDLMNRKLHMSNCWINIMPQGTHHSLHLHPLSVISGTYYVQTPKNTSSIKFEDPRLGLFMGSPPRKAGCSRANKPFVELKPKAGDIILFESWLRHEVPANPSTQDRISISFNYDWI